MHDAVLAIVRSEALDLADEIAAELARVIPTADADDLRPKLRQLVDEAIDVVAGGGTPEPDAADRVAEVLHNVAEVIDLVVVLPGIAEALDGAVLHFIADWFAARIVPDPARIRARAVRIQAVGDDALERAQKALDKGRTRRARRLRQRTDRTGRRVARLTGRADRLEGGSETG